MATATTTTTPLLGELEAKAKQLEQAWHTQSALKQSLKYMQGAPMPSLDPVSGDTPLELDFNAPEYYLYVQCLADIVSARYGVPMVRVPVPVATSSSAAQVAEQIEAFGHRQAQAQPEPEDAPPPMEEE